MDPARHEALAAAKETLRQEIRRVLRSLTAEACDEAGEKILERLREMPEWRRAGSVFCFVSVAGEVSTAPILWEALSAGKRLSAPRIREGVMEAAVLRGSSDLVPGPFGIPEPAGAETVEPGSLHLAIVPGLAFDRSGRRLGRGRAFYDRFLSGVTAVTVGVCHDVQLVQWVPAEATDVPVGAVVCPAGVYRRPKNT
jgi:5-formyltetrahydrofolate cyclo-ligase